MDENTSLLYNFEKSNGEILITTRLTRTETKIWFETASGKRRYRPSYTLLNHEKTQGIGYADNIYLDSIRQLIAASINNKHINLVCNSNSWCYTFENYISVGHLMYPDGRILIIEDDCDSIQGQTRNLFRPSMLIKDFIDIDNIKIWYVAKYSQTSNDNRAEVVFIFKPYLKSILLKFKGIFKRKSVARKERTHDRIRGYIAYYHIQGIVTVFNGDNEYVSENVDLYKDEAAIEDIALFKSKHETFDLINNIHNFSEEQDTSTTQELLDLDDLVGMYKVKKTFEEFRNFGEYKAMIMTSLSNEKSDEDSLIALYNKRPNSNLTDTSSEDTISLHMAFLGNPGTGKSTVAERIAHMLKKFGLIVKNDIPVVVVRSDLVGKYIGHTEDIVRGKIKEATNGILFIDEAHTLFDSSSGNDFGKIALNEIMYAMEKYHNQMVVVFAGYTDEMLYMLKNANPGLTSRIPWYFYFDDYTAEEMWEILCQKVNKNGRFKDKNLDSIKNKAIAYLSILKKELDEVVENGIKKYLFGNGRGVRTFFHYMQMGLAVRVVKEEIENNDLYTFDIEDIEYAFNTFKGSSQKLIEDKTYKQKIGFNT